MLIIIIMNESFKYFATTEAAGFSATARCVTFYTRWLCGMRSESLNKVSIILHTRVPRVSAINESSPATAVSQ